MYILNEDFNKLFSRLSQFFGRENHDKLHFSVSGGRKTHLLAYNFAKFSMQSRILRAIAAIGLYFIIPSLRCIPQTEVVLYGDTKNNRRALAEVSNLLKLYGHEWQFANKSCNTVERFFVNGMIAAIWQGAAELDCHKNPNKFLAMQLLVGLAARVHFQAQLKHSPCKAIVVANDHSPTAVALLHAASYFGIRTIYRQHAPVTTHFPPLSFDLALLYDTVSAETYEIEDGVDCRIKILSPFEASFRSIKRQKKYVKLGLCLSLVWDRDAVAKLIENMFAIGKVQTITLRAHPANQTDLSSLLAIPGILLDALDNTVVDFARSVDAVIISNSGIAVESLHEGKPVLYVSGLDSLGFDVYGFVAAGIILDGSKNPSGSLNEIYDFYDKAWKRRFARFDATLDQSPRNMFFNAAADLHELLTGAER